MVSKERIEQYKSWFKNLSFFKGNSFVLDEIEDLYSLLCFTGTKYDKFSGVASFKNDFFSNINKMECISLAQNFFDRHNIKLNIEELIESGILNLVEDDKKKEGKYFEIIKDGSSFYDENGERKISVTIEGTILDSAILIHEISHYRNQPKTERNFVSDLLTESIAYAMEMIFFEDLKSTYETDRDFYLRIIERQMLIYASKIYAIYKVILMYKLENDISKTAYDKVFNDNKYEKTLESFESYALERKSITRDTWLVLGLPLSVYMFIEYINDKSFFDKIEQFNEDINNKDIWDCLSTIGINGKEDFKNKIKYSTDKFIEIIETLYEEKNCKNY